MRKTNGNQTDDRERLSISDDDEICGTRIYSCIFKQRGVFKNLYVTEKIVSDCD